MLALIHSLAQVPFAKPHIDYHALAPEIVLTVLAVSLLIADLFIDETRKYVITTIAGVGVIAALIPIVTLAVDGSDRSLFGGAYVVDNFALLLKALFLVAGYLTLLMSSNYLQEGDYYEGEFSFLVVCSLLGMVVMASSRDLITIFVALETLSIPGYLLAGWRKRDRKSNEAALKYYLLGVVASAIMLYGMSLVYGITGSTLLIDIGAKLPTITDGKPLAAIGILMVIIGFAFKVSAVPFHQWAPDTYEGAPTPVTAFLAVASKAAGFVALITLLFVCFRFRTDVFQPMMWVLASVTMAVCEQQGIGARWWKPVGAHGEAVDAAAALLAQLRLLDVAHEQTKGLAYGKQRLIEIALALAAQPTVLLLDEPAAGVPTGESRELFETIAQLPRSVTIVLIEHDMDLVFRFAERISVMVSGAVLTEGSPQEIAADVRVRQVYLGEPARHG